MKILQRNLKLAGWLTAAPCRND